MKLNDFLKAGHPPTLLMAFLYFDMSFMVWVMLGPLGVHIARELALSPAEKGLMVAIPVLAGALFRVPFGWMVDSIGPKKTGLIGQVIVILGLLLAWVVGLGNLQEVYIMGILLGVAGASFAVALPLASRWYPPQYQGLALGIAGAGNSGTVFAALFAPVLANHFGWNAVFGLALIPLAVTLLVYTLLARDPEGKAKPLRLTEYFAILKDKDAWWFMFFYLVTFGGFVGLASSLVIYFNGQYGVEPATAGYLTAACVFMGSGFRPVGGYLADRFGGIRTLSFLYLAVALSMFIVSFGIGSVWGGLAAFMMGMMALGMGNGSVFQLVPQRFAKEIGVITGLVGMAGGIGGFYLASSLGFSKQYTGDYQMGFLIFSGLSLIAFGGLSAVKSRWRATWGSPVVTAARV